MAQYPKFYIAKNPMAEPNTEYIYHSQEPRFLAQRVYNDPLSEFKILDDIDNMAAFFKGDVSRIAGLMRRLTDWYIAYKTWEKKGSVNGSLLGVKIEEALAKYWYDTEYNYIDKSDRKKAEESRLRFRKWVDENLEAFSKQLPKDEKK